MKYAEDIVAARVIFLLGMLEALIKNTIIFRGRYFVIRETLRGLFRKIILFIFYFFTLERRDVLHSLITFNSEIAFKIASDISFP